MPSSPAIVPGTPGWNVTGRTDEAEEDEDDEEEEEDEDESKPSDKDPTHSMGTEWLTAVCYTI